MISGQELISSGFLLSLLIELICQAHSLKSNSCHREFPKGDGKPLLFAGGFAGSYFYDDFIRKKPLCSKTLQLLPEIIALQFNPLFDKQCFQRIEYWPLDCCSSIGEGE